MSWLIEEDDRKPAPYPAELCREADLDLTLRAIHGVWTSVFVLLVLVIFTPYFQEHPRTAFTFTGAMALIICLRLGFYRWQDRPAGRPTRLWRTLFLSTILLMGLC